MTLSTLNALAFSLAVIAAILLVIGGIRLSRKKSTRTQGILMIVAAAVLVMNVMIWTV